MKKALITGSSRGIGKAIAKRLASDGFEVFVNYVGSDEKACETKSEIEASGGKCTLIKQDLCDSGCAQKLYEVTGDVDVLILNASVQFRNRWEQITPEEFEMQVNCNLRSSLLLCQKYAPGMKKKSWGRIVTIGSVQERKPHPDMLVYSSTKAALTIMAQSLALQLASDGVTVNSVAPGVIYTDRNIEALSDPAYAEFTKSRIPMARWGNPDDCAGIVSFLCSEEAHYITGQNIFADGGMGIK